MAWIEAMRASIRMRVPQYLAHGGMNSNALDRESLRNAMCREIQRDVDAIMEALFEEGDGG